MIQSWCTSLMIVGLTAMTLSACASNTKTQQAGITPAKTAQLDKTPVIETTATDKSHLSNRIMKSAKQGTVSAVKGIAGAVKDTGDIATKTAIAGARIGGSAASEAGGIIRKGTKQTVDRLEKGMDFIMKAPATNDAASPVGNKTLADAALSPLSDFNIRKRERPEVLMRLQDEEIYYVEADVSCAWYDARIEELDDVLGDDYDVGKESTSNLEKIGKAGKGAVLSSVASAAGTYIPGRSMVRSLSGSKARQKETREIYQKGVARRAFLNGVSLAEGCPTNPS